MNNFPSFKNILFDLGGVILDLNVHKTLEQFLELGFPKELLNYPENFYTDVYFNYETGKVTTREFRDSIRKISGIPFTDSVFDEAWCSMLAKVPKKRTEILKRLAGQYQLFILSNTSELHIEKFNAMFLESAGYQLSEVFSDRFYSHLTGHHKPDTAAFEHVLEHAGIQAAETLFLDDNIHNVKAAREMGFNVIHITDNLKMEDVGYDL